MAKKNTLPQLTEQKIICYAINYLDSKIDEWEAKFADKDLSDPAIKALKDEVTKPFVEDKELLIKRYELEAGVEWQG